MRLPPLGFSQEEVGMVCPHCKVELRKQPAADQEAIFDHLTIYWRIPALRVGELLEHGFAMGDLRDWQAYEQEHGTGLVIYWLKTRVGRVAEIPQMRRPTPQTEAQRLVASWGRA
jgi:hypothetical protein